MTLDEVKKIANESGWPPSLVAPIVLGKLAEFARAVAKHEREQCAQYAENYDLGTPEGHGIAAAIRART